MMPSFSKLFRLLQFFIVKSKDLEDLKGPVAGAGIKVVQLFHQCFTLPWQKGLAGLHLTRHSLGQYVSPSFIPRSRITVPFKISDSNFCSGTAMIFLF